MLSKTLGVVMITPTLLLAIYITWIHRKEKSELLHNTAIVLWICANSVWMIGEFYYEDKTRSCALFFFFVGLLTAVYYYISEVIIKRLRKI
jgi:integral membrane sensor domain MASE1